MGSYSPLLLLFRSVRDAARRGAVRAFGGSFTRALEEVLWPTFGFFVVITKFLRSLELQVFQFAVLALQADIGLPRGKRQTCLP